MIDKFFEKDFFPKIFKKNGKKFGTGSRVNIGKESVLDSFGLKNNNETHFRASLILQKFKLKRI